MDFYHNIIFWPRNLNRDRMWAWELAARTQSSPRALSGQKPTTRFDGGGMWTAQLTDVRLVQSSHVLTWRALSGRLESGAAPFVMEMREPRLQPWPVVAGVKVTAQYESTNSDGSTCADGAGYVSDVIQAQARTAAALRATTLELVLEHAAALRGGEHFSIQHETFSHRLYRVIKVVKTDTHPHSVMAVTIASVGSPAVSEFTAAAHGLAAGQAVYFRSSGALPAGLAADTLYYVDGDSLGSGTFQVAATPGSAPIAAAGAGSGTLRVVTGGFPTVTIRPPLREATAAGTRVEFDYPKCVMKLAKPDAMRLALEQRFFGRSTVDLEEDFPPFDLVEGENDE